jgi:hypothetical protein
VSFANVEDVVAVNLTLMGVGGSNDILLAPDGSFQGFVPVRAGKNRIRVPRWRPTARAVRRSSTSTSRSRP